MTSDKIDPLVKALRHAEPSYAPLQGMENRVWRTINQQRADLPQNALEGWLTQVLVPEHRMASMSMAVMAGLLAAYVSVWSPQQADTATALNLHVFASDYGSPLQTVLKDQGDKI